MKTPAGLPVETERLYLRPMQVDDAAFILELLNEPSFLNYIGDKGVRTLEDALGYIQSAGWDNYETFGHGMNTVELRDASTRIGICGLLKRPHLDHPDIGFAFLEAFHGQGFATEASSAMLDLAREELGLTAVAAFTAMNNEASVRVLRKLGMTEGANRLMPDGRLTIRYFECSLL